MQTNDYGSETRASVDTETVCEIQQRSRSEEDDQQLGSGEWIGFFPAGTDLATADSIEIEGMGSFEMDGPAGAVWDPELGRESHLEVSLNQTGGKGA